MKSDSKMISLKHIYTVDHCSTIPQYSSTYCLTFTFSYIFLGGKKNTQ